MRLILARHGETEDNATGIITGHLPGKLTWKGVEQARRLALSLKSERIDAAYSSDLKRAVDTTKVILTYHPKTPLNLEKELRDRNQGSATGKKKEDMGVPFEKSVSAIPFEGAETPKEVRARAGAFLQKLISKHTKGTVLVVSHNAVLKALITILEGKSLSAMDEVLLPHSKAIILNVGKDGSVEPENEPQSA
jgi:probable phosphoglycerate mutase